MARQVKSVSIPERLQKQVSDIPNFTGWVIEALDNPRTSEAVSSAASNRRWHIRDLEHVLADLEDIKTDLKHLSKTKSVRGYVDRRYLDSLAASLEDISEVYERSLEHVRRRS